MNVDEEAIDIDGGNDFVDVSKKKKNPKRKLFVDDSDDDNVDIADEDSDETEATVDFSNFPTAKTVVDDQFKSMSTLPQNVTYLILSVSQSTSMYKGEETIRTKITAINNERKKYHVFATPTFAKMLFEDEKYLRRKDKSNFYFTYCGNQKGQSGNTYYKTPIFVQKKNK